MKMRSVLASMAFASLVLPGQTGSCNPENFRRINKRLQEPKGVPPTEAAGRRAEMMRAGTFKREYLGLAPLEDEGAQST
jgi:hypothetical protein